MLLTLSYKSDAAQIMLKKAKGKLKMAGKALDEKELDSNDTHNRKRNCWLI